MQITLCDRCGRVTKNLYAFLLPIKNQASADYSYSIDGIKFEDDTVILCNDCLKDFEDFRTHHLSYNKNLDREGNK